jgi:hypothetical protein
MAETIGGHKPTSQSENVSTSRKIALSMKSTLNKRGSQFAFRVQSFGGPKNNMYQRNACD